MRTPLIAINFLISKARIKNDKVKLNKYLHYMEINSKLLMNFINDLLDYGLVKANKLKLNIESFRIKSLLQNIAAVMAL